MLRSFTSRLAPRRAATACGILVFLSLGLASPASARQVVRLDGPPPTASDADGRRDPFSVTLNGWRFQRGDASGAEQPGFDDSSWRPIALPHDWSIEGERTPDAPSAGGGGFFPTGIGWYRLTFQVPSHWDGQNVALAFEGAYGDTTVWLNGEHLGRHRSGYTPFRFDVARHLRRNAANTLAVRVDNSAQPNSRWYSGSGLYRSVWLVAADPVQVEEGSLFVRTTDLFPEAATVAIDAVVANARATAANLQVEVTIVDPAGLPVAQAPVPLAAATGASAPLQTKLAIPHPQPWSPETPALYRAILRVFEGSRLTDRAEATFGLRTVEVSSRGGFRLNGEPVELLGANVHHDHGPLGAASFARAEERKVARLKAAGFNAVRTAHNPPSTAFLDACDRLGLLVIDEFFDAWAKAKLPEDSSRHFAETWPGDVDAIVRRDRNHPSIVMWSIGNEVYERGAASGAELAAALRQRIRTLDTTRPITAGINGLGPQGDWTRLDRLFASLDVAGYNYELARHAEDHARLPARVIMGAEAYVRDVFSAWHVVRDHSYVIGDFVWSGQDYLGEAGIGRMFPPDEAPLPHWEGNHFPWHGAACGDLDLLGHRKPVSHHRAIVWERGETLHAAVLVPTPEGRPWNPSAWAPPPLEASWTWPGHEGTPLQVEVVSRHPRVRLYLNDARIGEQPTTEAEQFRAVFQVPYAPGRLRAVGVRDDREVETFALETAGPPAQLRLQAEPAEWRADGHDLIFVDVAIVDADGRLYPHADHAVTYAVQGPAEIAGIGSSDLTTQESYQANPRRVAKGRALVILRTGVEAGPITLTAAAPGLEPATVTVATRAAIAP